MLLTSLAMTLAFTEVGRFPLAVIEVGRVGEPNYQAVAISLERDATPRSRSEWRQLTWRASRTTRQGTEEITSQSCPALRSVAEAFKDLPPITPTPPATIIRDEPLPLNTILLGGWGASVSFKTFGGADVTVSGSDAYAAWGSAVLNELVPCWRSPSV
jgi:hypothetical protein